MSKRKRLTPANPMFLTPQAAEEIDTVAAQNAPHPNAAPRRAPIADVATDAAAMAALEELSGEISRARDEGRMVITLPLERIRETYLERDRIPGTTGTPDEDMQALMDSIRNRGQQTPIEVVALEGGDYGLISGWRRCQALTRLAAETGAPAQALALLRKPAQASDAYVAMVEENEVRVGLSYYERARIVERCVAQGVFDSDQAGLRALFRAASRAKRSKIGSFLTVVRALDGALRFPALLGERLGLRLGRALEGDPALADRIRRALDTAAPADVEAEQALIQDMVAAVEPPAPTHPVRAEATPPAPGAASAPAPTPAPIPAPALSAPAGGAASWSARELAPGLTVRVHRTEARVELSGPALTTDLRRRIVALVKDMV